MYKKLFLLASAASLLGWWGCGDNGWFGWLWRWAYPAAEIAQTAHAFGLLGK
jgi:hypothetical protein